jgi:hypothetical protein
LLDVVFFVDMLLSFFTAYVLVDGNGRSTWVMSHNKIVHHYLATWFPLDAFTIFVPLSFDIISIAESTSSNSNSSSTTGEASGGGDAGSALRVLRVLRLTKLVRLVRASRLCVLPGRTHHPPRTPWSNAPPAAYVAHGSSATRAC